MVGVRYRRMLFPGQSDRTSFGFHTPVNLVRQPGMPSHQPGRETFGFRAPGRVARLDVTARLLYRKIDQFLLNYLFGESAGVTATVTVISEDTKSIEVVPRQGP
jgi:hypothetical protein